MNISIGRLEQYKRHVSEYINQIRKKDGSLQFEWFTSNDTPLKHQEHLGKLQQTFSEFDTPYSLTIYGDS
jgi:hypothetical protein